MIEPYSTCDGDASNDGSECPDDSFVYCVPKNLVSFVILLQPVSLNSQLHFFQSFFCFFVLGALLCGSGVLCRMCNGAP